MSSFRSSLCADSTVLSSNPVTGEQILASTVRRWIKLTRPPVQQTTGIVSFHDSSAKEVSVTDIFIISSQRSGKKAAELEGLHIWQKESSKYEPWVEDQKHDLLGLHQEQVLPMSLAIKTAVVRHSSMAPYKTVTKILASYKDTLYDASRVIDQLTNEDYESSPNGSRIPFWDQYDLVVSDPGFITKVMWLCPDLVTTETNTEQSSNVDSALVWCAVVIFKNGVAVVEMQITRQNDDLEVTEPANICNVTSTGTAFTAAKIIWYVEGKYDMCVICPIHLHIVLYRQNAEDNDIVRSISVFFNNPSRQQAYDEGGELSSCFSPSSVAYPIQHSGRKVHSVRWRKLRSGIILAIILEPLYEKGVNSSDAGDMDDYQVDIYALSVSTQTDVGLSNLLKYSSMTVPLTQLPEADVSRKKKYTFKENKASVDTFTKADATSLEVKSLGSDVFITDIHKISTLLLWEIRHLCFDSYTRTYLPNVLSPKEFHRGVFSNFLIEMYNVSSTVTETGGDQIRFIHVNCITGELYTYSFTYSDYSVFASAHHPKMKGGSFNKIALSPFVKMFGTIRRIWHVPTSNCRDVSKIFVTKPPLNSYENLENDLDLSAKAFSKYASRSRRWARLLCFSVSGAIALVCVPIAGQQKKGLIETIFCFGHGSSSPYDPIKKPLDIHQGLDLTSDMPFETIPLLCCLRGEETQEDVAVAYIYHTTKEGDLPLSQLHIARMAAPTNKVAEEECRMIIAVMGLHENIKTSEAIGETSLQDSASNMGKSAVLRFMNEKCPDKVKMIDILLKAVQNDANKLLTQLIAKYGNLEEKPRHLEFECDISSEWRSAFVNTSLKYSYQKPRYATIARINITGKGNQIYVMVWDCKKRLWGITQLLCDPSELIESFRSDTDASCSLSKDESKLLSDILPGIPGVYSFSPLLDSETELLSQLMLSFDGTRITIATVWGLYKTTKSCLKNITLASARELYIASIYENGLTKAVLFISQTTGQWYVLYCDDGQTKLIEGTILGSAACAQETFVTVSSQNDIVSIIVLVGGSLFVYEQDPAQLFIKGPPLQCSDVLNTLKFEMVKSWTRIIGVHSYEHLTFISDENSIIRCYEEPISRLGDTMDSFPHEMNVDLLSMCMDSRWNSLYRCLAYLSGERIWGIESKLNSNAETILGLSVGVKAYEHANCIKLPPIHEVVNIDNEVLTIIKMRDDDLVQEILSTFGHTDGHSTDIVSVNGATFHIPHEGAPLDSTSADALSYMCSKSAEALASNTVSGLSSRQQMDLLISVNTIRELVQQGKLCKASKRLLAHWKLSMIGKKMSRGYEKSIPSSAFCWATVSDAHCQLMEILDISQSLEYCISLGAPLWVKSIMSLRSITEHIGKVIFQKHRDVKKCALMYCLANKVNTLASLCKAVNEPKLHQFFTRDFNTAKNQNAASANAYAAIGKGDIHYGCAFFLLAGDAMSAATVVVQRRSDWILGLLLVRLGYNDDPTRIQEYNDFLTNSSFSINRWERCILSWRTGKYIEGVRELWDEGTSESLEFLNYCSDSVTVLSRRKHEVLPPRITVKLHQQAARKSLREQTFVTALRAHLSLWITLIDFKSHDHSEIFACSQLEAAPKSALTVKADFNTGQISMFGMDSFGDSDTEGECGSVSNEAPDHSASSNGGSHEDAGVVAWYKAADMSVSKLIEMTKGNIRRIVNSVGHCEGKRALRPVMCELGVKLASLIASPPMTPIKRRAAAIDIGNLIDTAVNTSDDACDNGTSGEILYTALLLQALSMVAVLCESEMLQYTLALSANNILTCQAPLSSQLNIIVKILASLEKSEVSDVTDIKSGNLLLIHISQIIRRLICHSKMSLEDPLVAILLQVTTVSFLENSNDLLLGDSFIPFDDSTEVYTRPNGVDKIPLIDKNELFNEIHRTIKKQLIPTSAELLKKNTLHRSHLLASVSLAMCSFGLPPSVRLPCLNLWRRPHVTNMSLLTKVLLTGSNEDIRPRLPAEIQVYISSGNAINQAASTVSEWMWSLERHTPERTRRALFTTAKQISLIQRSKHSSDGSPSDTSDRYVLSNIIPQLDTGGYNGALISDIPQVFVQSRDISSICIDQSNFDNLAYSVPSGVSVLHGMRDNFTKGNKEYVKSCQPQRDHATVTFFSSFPDPNTQTGQSISNKCFAGGASLPEMGNDHTLSSIRNITLMRSHPHLPVFLTANGSSGVCSVFQFGSDERLSFFTTVSGSALSSIAFPPLGLSICLCGGSSGTVSLWRFAPIPTLTRVLPGHFSRCGGGITYLRDHGSVVAVSGTDITRRDSGRDEYPQWVGGKLSIIDVASSAPTICNIHLPLSNPSYIFHDAKGLTGDILAIDTSGSICIFDIRAGKVRPRELTPIISLPQIEDCHKQKSGKPVQLTSAVMKLDEGLLALGASDGSIYMFESASLFSSSAPAGPLSPLRSISTHQSQVKGTVWWPIVDMCFSPSGLVYASGDGKVSSIPVVTAFTANMFV